MEIKDTKIKNRYADVGELVILFGNPFPVLHFVQQKFDKRQYWLEITDGISTYYTNINLTQWDKMDFETKAKIVEIGMGELKDLKKNY